MALIICPKCGKQISDRAEKCPQCGATKEEIDDVITERERLRREREAIAIEERRIQTEKRKIWWKKHLKHVVAFAITIIILTLACIAIIWSIRKAGEIRNYEESVTLAQSYIAKGDSCSSIFQFNEALALYNKAYSCTQDVKIRNIIQKKQEEILQKKMGE